MSVQHIGGNASNQSASSGAPFGDAALPSAALSAIKAGAGNQPPAVVLLTSEQGARQVFGVSERKFHEFRREAWFTARPRLLGPRTVRWVRAELEQAALNIPTAQLSEPARLLRGRVEKLKRGPAPAAAATA